MTKPGMGLVWLVSLFSIVLLCGGYVYLREADGDRDVIGYAGHSGDLRGPTHYGDLESVSVRNAANSETAVGTSGRTREVATDAGIDSPATIKELDTITGDNDGHELVGRKVDLHVPVQSRANNVSFWVGEKDNRLLVVVDRDRRTSSQRQSGEIAPATFAPLHAGESADIAGTIQKLPYTEAMYSWGLSRQDWDALASHPVYIRADAVRTDDVRE